MKSILNYLVFIFVLLFISCESWLDVRPADRTSGRELFETRQGFLKALNGVYVELTSRDIYGREMTAGMMDILGQYYRIEGTNNYFDCVSRYDHENEAYNVKRRYDNMWSKTYNQIVNLNIILEACGERNDLLPGIWFGLIKGEALALRAFLHLDMLRIFGPVHSDDPTGLSIPYVTNSDQAVLPLQSSAEIKELLLRDLTEAVELLKESDPIIENGVMSSDAADGDNSLRYRQFRLNYYAARALLARAYLWFGDKANAYTTAKNLLTDVGTAVFPFVSESRVTQAENPDRVFSSEIMFSLYDNNRTSLLYDVYFSPTLDLQNMYRLAYSGGTVWSGRISQLFVTPNDLRYKAWISSYNPTSGGTVHYISKYAGQTSGSYSNPLHLYMIPLIRITEVYLIAAECSTQLEEAKGYLSQVRTARSAYDLESVDQETLMENIEWEFRREFLGEGQMFYFYKRLMKSAIPNGSNINETETRAMSVTQYVVPLPDSETDERITD